MLKLCRVTKVKVLFRVLVYVFNFKLFLLYFCTFLILTYLNVRPPFWRRVYYRDYSCLTRQTDHSIKCRASLQNLTLVIFQKRECFTKKPTFFLAVLGHVSIHFFAMQLEPLRSTETANYTGTKLVGVANKLTRE